MNDSKQIRTGLGLMIAGVTPIVALYLRLGYNGVPVPLLLLFVPAACMGVYLIVSGIKQAQPLRWLTWCWRLRKTRIKLSYETTNLPYSIRGPRKEGVVIKTGFLQAWWWGHRFVSKYPRGAVYLDAVTTQAGL